MPPFNRSVFINCPFDEEYAPLLQAIAFCVTDLGFFPRLAPENPDNAAPRLRRILDLIRESQFGIHDLSRCKALTAGEFARMNMPFELGIDHGAQVFGEGLMRQKSILILESEKYDYQRCLSDIAGWDIESHRMDYINVVRIVRNWLQRHAGVDAIGANMIQRHYADFQKWHWEKELAKGASEEDILAYPTFDLIRDMSEWVERGRPV